MCIFCKIISNEIPSYKIYEDNEIIAILDITQVTKGHTLVIPKKHYANILESDDELTAKLFNVSKLLAIHISNTLKCNGCNILTNVNEVAGQSVFHTHIHVIPRYDDTDSISIEFNESAFKDSIEDTYNILKK